jgi:hypothetical protein
LTVTIGVLSDTHIPARGKQLPDVLLARFREVDVILHAGDWISVDVYAKLSRLAPVDGVAGNVDGEEILNRFGKKKRLQFEGVRIGMVHGHEGIGRTTPERAFSVFREERPDLIIFGHSHIPYLAKMENTLLFNPGSPTDKRGQPRYSFGIVTISGGLISAEHIYFDH